MSVEAIIINDVLKAWKQYNPEIKDLPTSDASVILKTLTPIFGVKGSIDLTSVVINGISKKYNGKFEGAKNLANLETRTLKTGVITPEVAHEPEQLRNTYLSECFKLKYNPLEYPFEKWVLDWAVKAAAQDLDNAIPVAKLSEGGAIEDCFDSYEEIIKADITAERISTAKKNLFDPSVAFTSANVGDKLLAMWRAADPKLRNAATVELRVSQDLYDMYEDWYKATHDRLPNVDTSGQTVLEGTQNKVKFIVHGGWTIQRAVFVIPGIMVYGIENLENMKKILPFISGNPHLYTATGKYNFGLQFYSVHSSVFLTNKVY